MYLCLFCLVSIRIFTNTICRRDSAKDPQRSEQMKERENSVLNYLKRRKAEYTDKYAYRNDPNAWIEKYVGELTERIECETGDIRLFLKDPSVTPSNLLEVVHGSRRMIALHHQERELILQGVEIPSVAFEAKASIAQGIWYSFFLTVYLNTTDIHFIPSV